MKKILMGLMVLTISFVWASEAYATSQAARRTGLGCVVCHDGFPRLNAFGELYMRNGYRIPGLVASHDRLTLEDVGDWFGVRLNMDGVAWANGVGANPDTLSFGQDKWAQFFIMGPVADRFSFFTEIEITTHGTHYSWWKVGYHPNPNFNLVAGNLSPVDYSSFSNRLRILPAVKSATYGLKPSDGTGVSSVNASSARPGVQIHGELNNENIIYYTGVSNGRGQASGLINFWAGAKVYFPTDGQFTGSSVSATYYTGTDANGTDPTAPGYAENDFSWFMPAANLRVKRFDLQAYGRLISEDNKSFARNPMSEDYNGWGFTAAWMSENDLFQPAIQYDKSAGNSVKTKDVETLVTALSYFPLENIRLAGYFQADLVGDAHKFFVNFRMMF